jgi:hypothetical protein
MEMYIKTALTNLQLNTSFIIEGCSPLLHQAMAESRGSESEVIGSMHQAIVSHH